MHKHVKMHLSNLNLILDVTFFTLILLTCLNNGRKFAKENYFWRGPILAHNARSPFIKNVLHRHYNDPVRCV